MQQDTLQAKLLLDSGKYTCVVRKGDHFHTATVRGVKPLLHWLDNGPSLQGFCAADRVVGRAAAFLYCLLGVREVYARVMSQPAADILKMNGIAIHADAFPEGIINRKGTGPCPFEAAVLHTSDPQEALRIIRNKLAEMESMG